MFFDLNGLASLTSLPNILKIALGKTVLPKIDLRYESLVEIALKANVLI